MKSESKEGQRWGSTSAQSGSLRDAHQRPRLSEPDGKVSKRPRTLERPQQQAQSACSGRLRPTTAPGTTVSKARDLTDPYEVRVRHKDRVAPVSRVERAAHARSPGHSGAGSHMRRVPGLMGAWSHMRRAPGLLGAGPQEDRCVCQVTAIGPRLSLLPISALSGGLWGSEPHCSELLPEALGTRQRARERPPAAELRGSGPYVRALWTSGGAFRETARKAQV